MSSSDSVTGNTDVTYSTSIVGQVDRPDGHLVQTEGLLLVQLHHGHRPDLLHLVVDLRVRVHPVGLSG